MILFKTNFCEIKLFGDRNEYSNLKLIEINPNTASLLLAIDEYICCHHNIVMSSEIERNAKFKKKLLHASICYENSIGLKVGGIGLRSSI